MFLLIQQQKINLPWNIASSQNENAIIQTMAFNV